MDFEVKSRYDAPLAVVHQMQRTAAYWQAKYEALGQKNVEVLECGEDGELFRVRTRRDVPVNVPSFAKKILSPFNTVIQTDEWSPMSGDQRSGTWTLEAVGKPIAMKGTMRLEPDGPDACYEVIAGTIEVSVRVVGGMIARFLVGDTKKSIADESEFTKRYLAEHQG